VSYRIGIDLGGTKIEGVILDDQSQPIIRERFPTEQEKGYDHILHQIKKVYDYLLKQIKQASHTVGMGTPGAFSQKTKFLKNSNTVCLNGRLTQQELEKKLGCRLRIENDANCFALAEALQGAGRGYHLVFGVIMGTGCGGGIVHEGKIITGLQHIAGEWGHMSINPQGPLCYCGQKGCVETYISGGGVEKQFAQAVGQKKDFNTILRLFRQGDPTAVNLLDSFFEYFGRALANVINVLDPDVIVLGGGLSHVDELYQRGIGSVKKFVFNDELKTPIIKNRLGDSAGVLGAALLGV